jgi:hypothetical protein
LIMEWHIIGILAFVVIFTQTDSYGGDG